MLQQPKRSTGKAKCLLAILSAICISQAFINALDGQTANWIWHPEQTQGQVPHGDCYFRKKVNIDKHGEVLLKVAGNDKYEVFLNGQLCAAGETTKIKTFDVSNAVKQGSNTIAVKVTNTKGSTAGFAAALMIKDPIQKRWMIVATDSTWKAHTRVLPIWKTGVYNDKSWKTSGILKPGKSKQAAQTASRLEPQSRPPTQPASQIKNALANGQLKPKTASQVKTEQRDDTPSNKETKSSESQKSNPESKSSVPEITFESSLKPLPIHRGFHADQVSSRKNSTTPVPKKGPLQPNSRPEEKQVPIKKGSSFVQLPKILENALGLKRDRKPISKNVWIADEFEVNRIFDGQHGSFIAMAFNEFGQLILSREGKGLIMVDFTTHDQSKRVQRVADDVTNVQGILPINGSLIVTGDGPDGSAIYHLNDQNRDGFFEQTKTILKFKGKSGEHGAHGLRLGPDGMIYVVIGNASSIDAPIDPKSPYRISYEGDLRKHFYEDPGGHALGIQAPGGTIMRISINGKKVETFAGGLRNAYDLTFNQFGDLFIHDSDMEADLGLPWYRPNLFFHVTAGAELGWRRGWAKWPEYFIDATRPIAKTGDGSPTGVVCYRHVTFPIRYQNAIFTADWLNGRISYVQLNKKGASYTARVKTFLEADGLTITDLDVGPDGALYFCTGGRGTEGGIYRIHWNGNVPESLLKMQNEFAKIVRMPQIDSAWAMQQRALLRQSMKNDWDQALYGIANETGNKPIYRINAMNAMLLYGPRPGLQQLIQWCNDSNSDVRKAATAMLPTAHRKLATEADIQLIHSTLINQLNDSNAAVRRTACETLIRLGMTCEVNDLVKMLKSSNEAESMAARRLLEKIPTENWKDICFNTKEHSLFCQMATALMAVDPKTENGYQILVQISQFSNGEVYDKEFLAMLRVAQLAILRCHIDPEKIPAFAKLISDEFPTKNQQLNRELARLMAILESARLGQRLADYLETSNDSVEAKLSVAMHLQTLGKKLQSDQRMALIQYLESKKDRAKTGSSYRHYLAEMTRELATHLTVENQASVLKNGAKWQNAALEVFFQIDKVTAEQIQWIKEIDQSISRNSDPASSKLKLGVIAILAESKNEEAMEYLRKIWRRDRNRRSDVVIGLAHQPGGKNWPYLVSSISQVEDESINEILEKLATVDRRPKEPKHYKIVLENGYKLRNEGAFRAARLLQHWTEQEIETDTSSWQTTLDRWRDWFEKTYPDQAPISIPNQQKIGKWKTSQILDFLDNDKNIGDADRGKIIYAKADCAKCHRYAGQGELMGPELTHIARRFSTREILQSILEPSKNISDQYAAHKVVTKSGEQIIGIMTRDRHGNVILLKSDGTKQKIFKTTIDEISEVQTSAMPDNLLEKLSEKDIADLFAYLKSSRRVSTATQRTADPVR